MTPAESIASSVALLLRSHTHAPARDILDLVMIGTEGLDLDFTSADAPHGSLAWPTSPLGQVIATVFDRGMEASDWHMVDRCDNERVIECLTNICQTEVLPKFQAAFRLKSLKA